MNPQRIVAAVAALAIGFGVTLAGVIATDDAADSVSTQSEIDDGATDDAADEIEAGNDAAEQQAEPAVEPAPAEAEPAPAEAPSQEAPSQPADEPLEEPFDVGGDCEVVYVVIGVEGDVAVLVDDDVLIAADGRVFLPGGDVSLDQAENIAQIQVRVASLDDNGDFVDCEDDTVLAERNADEFIDEIDDLLQVGAGEIPSSDVEDEPTALTFPCGGQVLRAIERTYIEQFGLDAEIDSDTDDAIVLVSLAQRVAAVSFEFGRPENDLEFWVDELEVLFSGFRVDGEVVEACALLTDNLAPAVETRAGFFCGVGQLSSDGQLLEFFDGLVPLPDDCVYPEADGGGIGSISGQNDQGEN